MSTKDVIAASLVELCELRSFDIIRVSDIVENCSMSKRTFYYHFHDKYELVSWIFRRNIQLIFEDAMDTGSYYDFLLGCALKTQELRRFWLNVVERTSGRDYIPIAMHTEALDLFRRHLCTTLGVDQLDEQLSFSLAYHFHALSDLVIDWVRDDQGMDAELFAQRLLECMSPDLRDVLRFLRPVVPEQQDDPRHEPHPHQEELTYRTQYTLGHAHLTRSYSKVSSE